MRRYTIVLDHLNGREAAALLLDGVLHDLLIDDDQQPRPGAIFRGICDRPMKGQGGMMMRLPDGKTGFLRQGKGLRPGQSLLLQVSGYAEPGKAVPLTDRLLFKSRYAIVTPGRPGINLSRQVSDEEERGRILAVGRSVAEDSPHGIILRSVCEGASDDEISEDIIEMIDLADTILVEAEGSEPELLTEGETPHAIAWREWPHNADIETKAGGFERRGVADQLETLLQPELALADGSMVVEQTRALIAVDVNTGGDTSPNAALKANLAAARALPKTLRLRGLGGQVVVDFAPMSKAHRKQLDQSLKASFKSDAIETSLVGWTTMGLFELQRKRERLPLEAILREGLS